MARTLSEIHRGLLDKVAADAVLGSILTSTSSVAIYRLFLYIVAYCAFSVEKIFDFLTTEINFLIDRSRAHPARWYVEMAKKFQYGFNLVPEKDYYNNTGIADDVVAASKIIAYASLAEEPVLRLKVATIVNGKLAKVDDSKMDAFRAYVMRYKDAGVKLRRGTVTVPTNITSSIADQLKLNARIKYNPLVLNDTGARIDGTAATPVADAIKKYLENIDFDGLFSVQKMVDEIQKVDGVEDLHIDLIQTKYGALLFSSVDIDFVPDGGYLEILPADLELTFLPA